MIESKELRIGNYVWEDYGGCYEVVGVDSEKKAQQVKLKKPNFKGVGQYNIEHIEPIPLTEEWLIKFGFTVVYKKNKHYNIQNPRGYKDLHKIHIFKTIGDSWHLAFSDSVTDKDYTPPCHFTHVHQLQNLYFALTGEELTIKE